MDYKVIILLLLLGIIIYLLYLQINSLKKDVDRLHNEIRAEINDSNMLLRKNIQNDLNTVLSKIKDHNQDSVQQIRKMNLIENQPITKAMSNHYSDTETIMTSDDFTTPEMPKNMTQVNKNMNISDSQKTNTSDDLPENILYNPNNKEQEVKRGFIPESFKIIGQNEKMDLRDIFCVLDTTLLQNMNELHNEKDNTNSGVNFVEIVESQNQEKNKELPFERKATLSSRMLPEEPKENNESLYMSDIVGNKESRDNTKNDMIESNTSDTTNELEEKSENKLNKINKLNEYSYQKLKIFAKKNNVPTSGKVEGKTKVYNKDELLNKIKDFFNNNNKILL
jgi:hypothetical protein